MSKDRTFKPLQIVIMLVTVCMGVLVVGAYTLVTQSAAKLEPADLSVPFSHEEYASEQDKLVGLMEQDSPKAVFAYLQPKLENDADLARVCHPLLHGLGHKAYEKYQDFESAAQFYDGTCNSGYLHGVIEAHFAKSEDIQKTLQTTCAEGSDGKFRDWQCFHGIGHGAMYFTGKDLPKSLSLCEDLPSDFAVSSCANGVFMERFILVDHSGSTAPGVNGENNDSYLQTCREQAKAYKSDCYLYAPSAYLAQHANQYSEALAWCESAETDYNSTCAAGVGGQAMKDNINQPAAARDICKSASRQQKVCLQGAIDLFINHHASTKPAEELCYSGFAEFKSLCLQLVQQKHQAFSI